MEHSMFDDATKHNFFAPGCSRREAGGSNSRTKAQGRVFHEGFVPQAGIDEGLEQAGAAFDKEGLQAATVEHIQQLGKDVVREIQGDVFGQTGSIGREAGCRTTGSFGEEQCRKGAVQQMQVGSQPPVTVYDEADGLRSPPMAHIQTGIVEQGGTCADKDGRVFGPALVYQHLCQRRREQGGLTAGAQAVYEAVGRLGPLQGDVRTVSGVKGDEAFYQPEALLLQHAYHDFASGFAQLLYASSVDTGKRVATSDDNAGNLLFDDEVGTGRCLAVMGTGFQTDVDGGTAQEFGMSDRTDSIDLGMCLAATGVIAFTDNLSVADDDGSHHGIGGRVATPVLRQPDATAHVFFFVHRAFVFRNIVTFAAQNVRIVMNALVHRIRRSLPQAYSPQEAAALSRIICCEMLGQSTVDYYAGKDMTLSSNEEARLTDILERLARFEPIQYVQGTARFLGRDFAVAPGVLIPRPETEELVERMLDELKSPGLRVLDVGTGSGCIAVTLALELPDARVTAWDISADTLETARTNAARHRATVCLEERDVLASVPTMPDSLDVLVSNPPYITRSERTEMERNVLDWEPDEALFVPDEDPLLFYRAIARLGQTALVSGGRIYQEINRAFGPQTTELLAAGGYTDVRLLKDLSGNDRFVTATRI